eukprot:scaffold103057_cov17-Prasinocladus_malaysianus.AAC.1
MKAATLIIPSFHDEGDDRCPRRLLMHSDRLPDLIIVLVTCQASVPYYGYVRVIRLSAFCGFSWFSWQGR